MILAEKIALLRRQNGWSQEELADQLNVSRQAVSKWEGGTSIPDLDKILKLSALFEVSTDYLLKDELEQPDATAPLPKEERVTEPCRTVSFDEANAYLSTVQAVHGKMAAGVGLCILSPIALLVLGAWSDGTPNEERMAGIGVIVLLLFVALGLLLILPATIRLEAFEYLEKEQIALAYGVEGIVERQKQEYAPTYRRSMTQGVVLCVLAVVPILGTAMLGVPGFWVAAAVGLLLAIVAGAVQLFIRAGMTQGSFDKLLQTVHVLSHYLQSLKTMLTSARNLPFSLQKQNRYTYFLPVIPLQMPPVNSSLSVFLHICLLPSLLPPFSLLLFQNLMLGACTKDI